MSARDSSTWGQNPRLTPTKIPPELRMPVASVGSVNGGLAFLAESWERSLSAEME